MAAPSARRRRPASEHHRRPTQATVGAARRLHPWAVTYWGSQRRSSAVSRATRWWTRSSPVRPRRCRAPRPSTEHGQKLVQVAAGVAVTHLLQFLVPQREVFAGAVPERVEAGEHVCALAVARRSTRSASSGGSASSGDLRERVLVMAGRRRAAIQESGVRRNDSRLFSAHKSPPFINQSRPDEEPALVGRCSATAAANSEASPNRPIGTSFR